MVLEQAFINMHLSKWGTVQGQPPETSNLILKKGSRCLNTGLNPCSAHKNIQYSSLEQPEKIMLFN